MPTYILPFVSLIWLTVFGLDFINWPHSPEIIWQLTSSRIDFQIRETLGAPNADFE